MVRILKSFWNLEKPIYAWIMGGFGLVLLSVPVYSFIMGATLTFSGFLLTAGAIGLSMSALSDCRKLEEGSKPFTKTYAALIIAKTAVAFICSATFCAIVISLLLP